MTNPHIDNARQLLRQGDIAGFGRETRAALDDLQEKIDLIPENAPLTPDDVIFFVNEFIKAQAPANYDGDAINWANIRCIDVNLNLATDVVWLVISEASPECSKLPAAIEAMIRADMDLDATVFCEW